MKEFWENSSNELKENENLEKNKKKTNQFYLLVVGLFGMVLFTICMSYAYIKVEKKQTQENMVGTLCLDIAFEEDKNSAIQLENAYPISDTDGMLLKPYTFKVTNKCENAVKFQVNMDILDDVVNDQTALPLQLIQSSLLIKETDQTGATVQELNNGIKQLSTFTDSDPVLDSAYSSKVIHDGTVAANHAIEYKIRLWIKEDTSIAQGSNKHFAGKVAVIGSLD